MPDLMDYATGECLGPATPAQQLASIEAAKRDGGAGVIDVDGRACYVEGSADDEALRMAAATLGRKGGQARTPAQTEARRRNAQKGGRPRKDGHRHRVASETMRCWVSCVAGRHRGCDQRAHGNVVFRQVCACGATREVASNQGWQETSGWIPAKEETASHCRGRRPGRPNGSRAADG